MCESVCTSHSRRVHHEIHSVLNAEVVMGKVLNCSIRFEPRP